MDPAVRGSSAEGRAFLPLDNVQLILKSLRSDAGTEARSSYLLTAVAGGFAVALVRNETQQHTAALKNAGQNPIGLLPLSNQIVHFHGLLSTWCTAVPPHLPESDGFRVPKLNSK